MKKVLAILLAVFMFIGIAACGDGDKKETTGDGAKVADLVDILLPDAVTTPDPHHTGGAGSGHRAVFRCIFDRLVSRTLAGDYVPELATSWDTDDMQSWTFHLRNDVTFHNGQKFTAQDVIDTVASAQANPGTVGFNSWGGVDTITATDEYTVQIVLNTVNVDFLFFMSDPGAFIINKAARDADPVVGAYMGTGAFYVDDFVSGEYITLTRNEDYWGDAPLSRQLRFSWVPEMTARPIMLQNDESHFAWRLTPEDVPIFENDPEHFTIHRFTENACFSLAFNMNDPITGDINFRRAVAYAMNLADIGMAAEGNNAVIQQDGTFWGYSTEFRNTGIPRIQQNIDTAKQYLADSSYDGEEVEIMAALPPNIKAAEMMVEQLGAIGININLFITDIATLNSVAGYGNDVTQMVVTVSPFNSSAASARNYLHPAGSGNRSNYNSPQVNDLFEQAATTIDKAAREAIYKQIQVIVSEDLPMINHFHLTFPMVSVSNFRGFIIDPDQNHDFRYVYLELEG